MVRRQNKSTLVQCFIVVSKGFGNLGEKKNKEQGFRLPGARQDIPPEELESTEAQR